MQSRRCLPRIDYKPFTILGDQQGLPVITRLAPFKSGFELEWLDTGDKQNRKATLFMTTDMVSYKSVELCDNFAVISAQPDRMTVFYLVTPDGRESRRARVQCADYPGESVINYLHPDDNRYDFSGKNLCSPSIVRSPKGELLVTMDVFEREKPTFLTILCKSSDQGKSWRYVTDIAPMYWGSLFTYGDKLYLLGVTTGCCQLTLAESEDDGETWRSTLIGPRGYGTVKGNGPHKAPVRVHKDTDRIWLSVEWGSWHKKGYWPGAISAPIGSDIMKPESWTVTGFLPHLDGQVTGSIEGSVICAPDGRLVNFLRRGINKAHVITLDRAQPGRLPTSEGLIECPFAHTKFQIEQWGGKYYAIGNQYPHRNKLAVYVSDDLAQWSEHKVIADYQHLPPNHVGLQYPSFIIENGEALIAVRTAINGAQSFHDSNCITFHRVKL